MREPAFSYAQYGEDKFIWDIVKRMANVPRVIVDIGASNGVNNSNSRWFIHMGWTAFLYEPDAHNFRLLQENTNNHELGGRVHMRQVAVSNVSGMVHWSSSGGQSQITGSVPGQMQEMVQAIDWSGVLKDTAASGMQIGILDIDTEGQEEKILRDMMRSPERPNFIIVEHQGEEHRKVDQRQILWDDYRAIRHKGVNTIWQLK